MPLWSNQCVSWIMWRFPKIRPSNHPFMDGENPWKPSSDKGVPFQETSMSILICHISTMIPQMSHESLVNPKPVSLINSNRSIEGGRASFTPWYEYYEYYIRHKASEFARQLIYLGAYSLLANSPWMILKRLLRRGKATKLWSIIGRSFPSGKPKSYVPSQELIFLVFWGGFLKWGCPKDRCFISKIPIQNKWFGTLMTQETS